MMDTRFVDVGEMSAMALSNLGFVVPWGKRAEYGFSGISVYAEALRSALWALTEGGVKSVYVTRVLNAAQKLVQGGVVPTALAKEMQEIAGGAQADDELAGLREVLEQLQTMGDVAELPKGHWLPAPLRVLHLEAVDKWMLVGGAPSALLLSAGIHLEHRDVARFATEDPNSVENLTGTQHLKDWLRAPDEALKSWTESVFAKTKLLPFEDRETKFEIYAPTASKFAPDKHVLQYHRWRNTARGLSDGVYLVRNRGHYDAARYALGRLEAGTVVATEGPRLGHGDIRRLMYGIDMLAGRPTGVEMTRVNDKVVFVLRNEVPNPERRLFMALGRLQTNKGGRYYPRKWEFGASYILQVHEALEALGIAISG